MTNNQTNWQELCVQLYAALEAHSTTWDDEVLLDRVGTALRLAQPEPEEPTDEEILALSHEHEPLSLKEQALMALENGDTGPGASLTSTEVSIIRRALEALPDD